ncbi:hypothetical protein Aab01nite_43400 [Paractinoplanes abujensis]|uniref:Transcriptional regulator LacI/GalR-like sensor domain-containing protein n=1 Tax=Paractinoplanes abujensis TaxID=882441 RepID=A0A7W7FYZ3_9ACTN|nr:hypothetical protein [Actinoplanes abujensis]GID20750.1 hypothetical protein Aab01nite_43400 [Actinoplanes abujensis]
MAAALLPVPPGDWSARSGYDIGTRVEPGDFTGNDQMTLVLHERVTRPGSVAPADYSIAGVDDMPAARHFAPPLTRVWTDSVEMGRVGFRMPAERITTGERVSRHVIHPNLVVRESTAAAGDSRSAAGLCGSRVVVDAVNRSASHASWVSTTAARRTTLMTVRLQDIAVPSGS